MTTCLLALLLASGVAQNEQILDSFQYPDHDTARQAWKASNDTPQVEVISVDQRTWVQFEAPFGSLQEMERTTLDRVFSLDLASAGEFHLELDVDQHEAVGHVTLYFHSGKGWYAGGGDLAKSGPNTLRFPKESFRIEEEPAGWDRIDGIRISIWRGKAVDASIRLGRLAAISQPLILVVPDRRAHPNDREVDAALSAAEMVRNMIEELGLGVDTITDTQLTQSALGARRVVLLAHHPWLDFKATEALVRFVESGGKVFACYHMPVALGRALGFENQKYVRPERGTLAEVRFEASDIPGIPQAVRQASWNITSVEPTLYNSRVIGHWFDSSGSPTEYPALLLSDRGAFFTHILLSDDRTKKREMLAAILGRFEPSLWRRMAEEALERASRIGHFDELDAICRFIAEQDNAEARKILVEVISRRKEAQLRFDRKEYHEAVLAADASRELLAEAYFCAHPSPTIEGRAFWNHSGTGAYPGDWERSARELSEAGFNMVLPNMLWGGRAHYPSRMLPQSGTFREYGDQMAQCVAACKRHGIEVHVWKVNYNLSGAPKEFVDQMRNEGRTQVDIDREPQNWLCPSHPENIDLELQSMLEVARLYDVDGLHFDYIRYPGSRNCYCDGCRQRFEADSNGPITDWPEACFSGRLKETYRQWRCDQITKLVAAVHREAKKLKPKIKISAAVFGAYPDCTKSVAQDWLAWVEAGYLDFICPMDYTQSDTYFQSLVHDQVERVDGRIPIYPGIGAWRLTPDRALGQIHHARTLGSAGFTLFNLTDEAAKTFVPAVGLGAGRQPAVPPHQQKQ